jgi:chitinase
MLKKDGSDGYITYDDPVSTYLRVWYFDWDRGLRRHVHVVLDADYDGHSRDLLDAMYTATVGGER